MNNITPPGQWEHEDYAVVAEEEPKDITEEQLLEIHKILSLEKLIPFSNALLRSACTCSSGCRTC